MDTNSAKAIGDLGNYAIKLASILDNNKNLKVPQEILSLQEALSRRYQLSPITIAPGPLQALVVEELSLQQALRDLPSEARRIDEEFLRKRLMAVVAIKDVVVGEMLDARGIKKSGKNILLVFDKNWNMSILKMVQVPAPPQQPR